MSVDSTYPTGSEGLPALEQADLPDVIHEPPDPARRRALVAATTAVGGITVAVATVPPATLMAVPVVPGAALPLRGHIHQIAELRQ